MMSVPGATEMWSGEFGDQYLARNRVAWERRVPFWAEVVRMTQPGCVLEIGSNAGWNLTAIQAVDTTIDVTGLEVNSAAAQEANARGISTYHARAKEAGLFFIPSGFDLIFTAGVLIHIPPEDLQETMRILIQMSKRWVLAVEYAADQEEEVEYRGQAGRLWRRPFGKLYEAMGLTLVKEWPAGEGFDNCQSWLMEKINAT